MLKSFASLRSRAIFLVLLAILPLLALTLYSYLDQRDRAILRCKGMSWSTARNLATIQETLIRSTRQLLETLARTTPGAAARPGRPANALFAGVLKQSPYYAVLAAADPEGQVFASAPGGPGTGQRC